jgi:hypothetical protein
MRLVMHSQAIAVVGLPPGSPEPSWATGGPLISITRTEHETSVICPTSSVPEDVPGPMQGPLVGVYVDEQLDFSQAGILVALLKPLADAGIPVLTVSTYDTDWVLLESAKAAAARSVWRAAGYQVLDAASVSLDDEDADAVQDRATQARAAQNQAMRDDTSDDESTDDESTDDESTDDEATNDDGDPDREASEGDGDRVVDVRDPVPVPDGSQEQRT